MPEMEMDWDTMPFLVIDKNSMSKDVEDNVYKYHPDFLLDCAKIGTKSMWAFVEKQYKK